MSGGEEGREYIWEIIVVAVEKKTKNRRIKLGNVYESAANTEPEKWHRWGWLILPGNILK